MQIGMHAVASGRCWVVGMAQWPRMQGGKWPVLASKHAGGDRQGMRAVAYACIHARAELFLFPILILAL
jgi:hypothetical protein